MGAGAGACRGSGNAARKCAPFPHPVDRRKTWRLLEVGRARRHSHGPREHESARPGVRARLERQSRRRRPAIRDRDPWRDAAGRCRRDLHDQRRDGELEEPGRRRQAALFRAARSTSRRAGRSTPTAWFLEALLARPDRSLDLLPGRQSARGQVDRSRSRHRRGTADHHALGASPASARRRLPIWADASNKFFGVHFGIAWLPEGLCRRTVEDRGGAGDGDGGAGAGAGQIAGDRARGAGGVHGRPALRRRRTALPDRPDGGRRQGRDRRRRRLASRSRCRPARR